MLDLRKHFKIYEKYPDLVYLDSGATSLKPTCVIEAMDEYYFEYGVNIHRGVYKLSHKATEVYEESRRVVAKFLNCRYEEVIFTKNASEALNLVAMAFKDIKEGDEIITSVLEHHSSFLPWLNVCKQKGAVLKFVELNSEGRIEVSNFKKVLTPKCKVVALNYFSNVLGYETPIKEIITLSHEVNAVVVVDAAQAVSSTPIDVIQLDCDFLAFSAHKMMGPTGVGVLYGKLKHLRKMDPIYYGGDMNEVVGLDFVEIKSPPYKFETGTVDIAGIIGLKRAIEFINEIGYTNIKNHGKSLYNYTISKLTEIEGLTIYNKNPELPIISFNITGIHPHDAATFFDEANICLRAGHHCAQLLSKWLNCYGTLRASFYIYNTIEDCDKFINAVIKARDFFRKLNGEEYE